MGREIEVESYTEAEAKKRLSELVRRAEAGETIGISRDGVVVAWLEPAAAMPEAEDEDAQAAKRLFGCRRFD